MKWTGLNELREKYLAYFESNGHKRLPSFPLIPQGDNTLLLVNAGMAPMKKFFLGQEQPPAKRVCTCQKCIRTPDIERVGKTARHGTYFEMLGNFSFGDYFKNEAIAFAWEFCTKVLEMPADKLYISVYTDDDEAYDIWTKKIGVAPDHMVRFGKEDNFWEHGSLPCGPCSEIYYDRGEKYGCGSPSCKVGCDCDRYVEFWNVVFQQFDSDGKGNYTPLKKPNIDTGMGLERLAVILQDVNNLFEVDTLQNIMKHICEIAGVTYKQNAKTDVSLRVITDHIRSTTFMVGDGVMPSNEGRGYVLRRLLRRAARHGRLLGVTEPFIYKVCDTVINENAIAYPELAEKRDYIKKVIRIEEENFAKTIDKGMELLNQVIDDVLAKNGKVISGDDTFKLSDTFGFPIDLTIEIAEEKGLSVDEKRFQELVQEQRAKARADRALKAGSSWNQDKMGAITEPKTVFTGYGAFDGTAKVVALFKDGKAVEHIAEGDDASIVLDTTPFYAESGGQVGDTGTIFTEGSSFEVIDCKKTATGHFVHSGTMAVGELSVGDSVNTAIDAERRKTIMRNHTSAHLLQQALRMVLGSHVHQAGSLVDETKCRFDFSHFSAVTPKELAEVESIVNGFILDALDVNVTEMPINDAKALGATALFGEKYGDIVRVCNISEKSIELCGGTHIDNTAKIGLFKIVSEASVAAGVRRIEAATGLNVIKLIEDTNEKLYKSCENLKISNVNELAEKTAAVAAELKAKDKQIEELNAKIAEQQTGSLFENAVEIGGVTLVTASLNGTKPDVLRTIGDKIKDKSPKMVGVLVSVNEGKASLLAVCGAEAVKLGVNAGKLVKEIAAKVGGSGGGRPDSAMGGIADTANADAALKSAAEIIKTMLK